MSPLNVSRIAVAFLLVGNVLVSAPRAVGGDNYAFLVAVGDYDVKQFKPLAYTRNDVLEFAKALTDSGFKSENIVLMHDVLKTLKSQRYLPQAEKIRKEFDLLLSGVDEGDSVIVAFAGHGVQFEGDDRNFFCPVDADLEEPKRQSLISLKEIYTKLEECPADRKLLLVDACRNDPLSKLARSREKVKLNSVTRPQIEPVPKGIVALFSCSAGQESYEWPDLEHGVFFQQILTGWKGAADTGDQELSLDELVAYTRKNTQTFARLKLGAIQTPQMKGEFNGTWVLRKLGIPSTLASSIGMKLTLIPAGEFWMGSPDSDEDAHGAEKPQHRVKITKPFYLGIHEVTRGQFAKFVADTGYKTEAEADGKGGSGYNESTGGLELSKPKYNWKNTGFTQTDEHPVVNVTWNDAVKFCEWLSRKEKVEYRLPTEAEWEYACRGGMDTRYSFGDDAEGLIRVANMADATAKSMWGKSITEEKGFLKGSDGFAFTAPAGRYPANPFGLHDMHGNVCEWCSDSREKYGSALRIDPVIDPQVIPSDEIRAVRGGNWNGWPEHARSASRLQPQTLWAGYPPRKSVRLDGLGFRVLSTPTSAY